MNYGSGNGSFTPTATDGKTFDPPSSSVTFQEGSHPHMALEYGGEVFVPDLVSVVLIFLLPFGQVSDLHWSSAFDRVGTKFGASTVVVMKFMGSFNSEKEAVPGISSFTVRFLAF